MCQGIPHLSTCKNWDNLLGSPTKVRKTFKKISGLMNELIVTFPKSGPLKVLVGKPVN